MHQPTPFDPSYAQLLWSEISDLCMGQRLMPALILTVSDSGAVIVHVMKGPHGIDAVPVLTAALNELGFEYKGGDDG